MSRDPSQMLEEAGNAFSAGDFQSALDLWTAVLEDVEAEHHYALHTNRGAALERLGRLDEAIGAYDAALTAKPEHVEAWHNRGVALKAMGRMEDALESFEKALSCNPEFFPSLRGRTDALTALERFDEAVAAADAAIAAEPSHSGPHADKAFALLKSKRIEEALGEYEAARSLGDSSTETTRLYAIALSQRAVELDKANDMDGAERLYNEAITIEPTESRIFNRAFLYMRTGRNELAMEGYKQVMQLSKENFQARAALGTLLLQAEKFDEAAAVLQEAQELKSDAADIVFNLGFAYLKQEALDAAEAQFKRALELEPEMEQAKNGLAVVEQARSGGQTSKQPKYRLNLGPPVSAPAHASAASSAKAAAAVPASNVSTHAAATFASGGAPPSVVSAAPSKTIGGAHTGSSPSPHEAQVRSAKGANPGALGGVGKPAAASTASPTPAPADSSTSLLARAKAIERGGRRGTVFASGVPVLADVAAELSVDAPATAPKRATSPSAELAQDVDGFDGMHYSYAELKAPGPYPDGIDLSHREAYMSMAEFVKVFGMKKTEFYKMPKWKRTDARKKVGLF